MIFNIHAGHNPDGKTACGAAGLIKESTEARAIAAKVIEKLRYSGHTVYDCTVNDGTSQNDVLSKIVAKCNQHSVDVDVSIHLNSGRNDYVGDGSIGGTEVFCYNVSSKAKPYAQNVVREISALGFRLRDDSIPDDIKTSSSLYVLKNTKAPAMLIECFFVDDQDDVNLYQKIGGADGIADAIVKGLLTNVAADPAPAASQVPKTETSYDLKQFIMDVQAATGAKVDGIAESETISKTVTVSASKNQKHAVVPAIQKRLNSLGYDCGVADGIAGSKFTAAVNSYQKNVLKYNSPDGEITAKNKMWKSLLGMD